MCFKKKEKKKNKLLQSKKEKKNMTKTEINTLPCCPAKRNTIYVKTKQSLTCTLRQRLLNIAKR